MIIALSKHSYTLKYQINLGNILKIKIPRLNEIGELKQENIHNVFKRYLWANEIKYIKLLNKIKSSLDTTYHPINLSMVFLSL